MPVGPAVPANLTRGRMTDARNPIDRSFFRDLQGCWKAVTDHPSDVMIALCGQTVRIRFSDDRLRAGLTMAFRHALCEPSEHTDLTILVGCGNTMSLPDRPVPGNAFGRRCELHTKPGSGLTASFMLGPDILSILDHERSTALYWIRNGTSLPAFEQAAPFRHILHWYLRERGWILVHAAAIGRKNRGVLICGKGGSGKSTLAAATWRQSGWQFAGDDYCAVSTRAPHQIFPVYPTAKLTVPTMRMLSLQQSRSTVFDGEKAVWMAHDHCPERIPEYLKPVGLIIPSRTREPAPPTRLSPAVAARHLVISTLYQMPFANTADHQELAELTRTLPAWQMPVPEGQPRSALSGLDSLFHQMERTEP